VLNEKMKSEEEQKKVFFKKTKLKK